MTPEQLKTSILLNAIQGKLVEQIDTELCCDIKSTYQGEASDLFDIPVNWKWVAIKDVATINTGLAFKKQDQKTSVDGTLRILRGGNIGDDYKYHLYDNDIYVDLSQFKDKYIPLQIGDVITPSVTSMEKMCKTGFIDVELENTTAGGFVYIIRSNNPSILDSKYLLYFISSSFNKEQCKPNIHKSGQAFYNLKKSGFVEQPICLPPIEEQHRIVSKIEELLPYIDRYAEAYQKLEQFNVKFPEDMKKSILQYAIQGKLVEQRPEEGTGEELYNKIQDEKKRLINEGKIKKEKFLADITDEDIPFDIPNSWEWVRLIDIIKEKPTNGYSPKGVDYETKYKNLTLTATTSGIFKRDAFKYVDIDEEKARNYWLKKGDILIQRSNSRELVGTSCIYNLEDDFYLYPDLMMRIHPMDSVDVKYLDYVLKSPHVKKYYSENATGTSESMPKINQSIVSNTLIPLPPLMEQQRIVEKIESTLPYCEQLSYLSD